MKKITLTIITLSIMMLPLITWAADPGNPPDFNPYDANDMTLADLNDLTLTKSDVTATIAALINIAFTFLGLLALILVIYAGWLWMSAQGEEEQITKAKNILKGAAIGLLILLSSYSIAYFVFTNLGAIVTNTEI